MATEQQLAAARAKTRTLSAQLDAVEEMNGYRARSYGVRLLKQTLSAGSAATAGAISDIEYGAFKMKYVNYALGTIGVVGQVLSEPDGAGDVISGMGTAMFHGQLGVSASGRVPKP